MKRNSKPVEQEQKERALLVCEALGVLERYMVFAPVFLSLMPPIFAEEEGVTPPRLLLHTGTGLLFHCVGSSKFYEDHPEYTYGGLSAECHVIDYLPAELSNYLAMEDTYVKCNIFEGNSRDPLSVFKNQPEPSAKKPAPLKLVRKGKAE